MRRADRAGARACQLADEVGGANTPQLLYVVGRQTSPIAHIMPAELLTQ